MIAFTSTDGLMNKANISFLGSRLHELARSANQWDLTNVTAPAVPPMSEADRADAEWLLQEMLLRYPILGLQALRCEGVPVRVDEVGTSVGGRWRSPAAMR